MKSHSMLIAPLFIEHFKLVAILNKDSGSFCSDDHEIKLSVWVALDARQPVIDVHR